MPKTNADILRIATSSQEASREIRSATDTTAKLVTTIDHTGRHVILIRNIGVHGWRELAVKLYAFLEEQGEFETCRKCIDGIDEGDSQP